MAVMMASVGCQPRLLMIVATVAVFLGVAVVMIAMRVAGIIMAIETNRMRVARIAALIGGISARSRVAIRLEPHAVVEGGTRCEIEILSLARQQIVDIGVFGGGTRRSQKRGQWHESC
uniref:Uncharacterized protein n=1 Tax=Romanomermis culicivorax TaxID=13658 RepID=A0A915KW74_ROMCU